jgi:gliding motility-associated-like protein
MNKIKFQRGLSLACFILINHFVNAQNWTWINGDSIPNQSGVYSNSDLDLVNPGSRTYGVTWTDNQQNLWLFGGTGYDVNGVNGILSDLWKYNPVTNSWKKVKGSSVVGQNGNYTSQGSSSPDSYPGSRSGAITWTDTEGNLWLYGGTGMVSNFVVTYSDLWMFSPDTEQWTWISGTMNQPAVYGVLGVPDAQNTPGERHRSASWTDNNGDLWLFGGGTTFNFKSDLWKYSMSTNTWTWIHGSDATGSIGTYGQQGVASSTNEPGARSATYCFKDRDDNFWLFGGYGASSIPNYTGSLNDLWKYNSQLNQWTWVSGSNVVNQIGNYGVQGQSNPANVPGGRFHCNGWVDQQGTIYLFGGMGYATDPSNFGVEKLNDLWKFDTQTSEWTWLKGSNSNNELSVYGSLIVPDPVNTPGARYGYMTWANDKGLWLFGGLGYPGSAEQPFGYHNDLWRFGLDTLAFEESENQPPFAETAPNVFTPNGDGINDLFLPVETTNTESYSFTILNRWGEIVFETSDEQVAWDGTFGDTFCNDGVYFWKTHFLYEATEIEKHGSLTLIR